MEQRRNRTRPTEQQIDELEREFERTHYPDRVRREQLSNQLQLPEVRIKMWFQKRRLDEMRQRRANI